MFGDAMYRDPRVQRAAMKLQQDSGDMCSEVALAEAGVILGNLEEPQEEGTEE